MDDWLSKQLLSLLLCAVGGAHGEPIRVRLTIPDNDELEATT
jgi:hypothetical protein